MDLIQITPKLEQKEAKLGDKIVVIRRYGHDIPIGTHCEVIELIKSKAANTGIAYRAFVPADGHTQYLWREDFIVVERS